MAKKKWNRASVKTAVLGDFDYGFLCMVSLELWRVLQHRQQGLVAERKLYLAAADRKARTFSTLQHIKYAQCGSCSYMRLAKDN